MVNYILISLIIGGGQVTDSAAFLNMGFESSEDCNKFRTILMLNAAQEPDDVTNAAIISGQLQFHCATVVQE